MGLDNQVEKPGVNQLSILSSVFNYDFADEEEDLSEAMSQKDFKQQIEDYANLATMFKQLVDDNVNLADETEKYKLALEELFSPYDSEKVNDIEALKVKIEEMTLRKKELET